MVRNQRFPVEEALSPPHFELRDPERPGWRAVGMKMDSPHYIVGLQFYNARQKEWLDVPEFTLTFQTWGSVADRRGMLGQQYTVQVWRTPFEALATMATMLREHAPTGRKQ